MPEPTFIVDPNHQRKMLAGNSHTLACKAKLLPKEQLRRKPKEEAKHKGNPNGEVDPKMLEDKDSLKAFTWNLTMTKMDVGRPLKNFAFVASALKHRSTDDEILQAERAALEYHFDNYVHCSG